ncbi:MAG: DinB family protein [Candidatus Thorarchaeota archaeon]
MNLEKTIQFFVDDHQKLENILSKLNDKQLNNEKIQGNWTVKDIIAHISAWNWELITQTDLVLSGRKPWYSDTTEAEFNRKAVRQRKSWSLEKTLSEWRESFESLISRIKKLSIEEWTFGLDDEWPEGGKITVASIFGYRYYEEGHEGGHAKVIQKHFNIE